MKKSIQIIDRASMHIEEEQVWGEGVLHFLYGKSILSKIFGTAIRKLLNIPIFSRIWGWFHDRPSTKKSVIPFCRQYNIDTNEFLSCPESFKSFNDFFVRHLKKDVRPICAENDTAVLPADARYTFLTDLGTSDFLVKGVRFNLKAFLKSDMLAERFEGGVGILARLCPTDCHRFFFPVSGKASRAQRIDGGYLSVSPIATHSIPSIFWTNVRELTLIESEEFGHVAMVEIGATNCASIVQTYTPGNIVKGEEKGYFRLGGSAIMLLFEKDKISLSPDIIALLPHKLEIRGLYGQALGNVQITR